MPTEIQPWLLDGSDEREKEARQWTPYDWPTPPLGWLAEALVTVSALRAALAESEKRNAESFTGDEVSTLTNYLADCCEKHRNPLDELNATVAENLRLRAALAEAQQERDALTLAFEELITEMRDDEPRSRAYWLNLADRLHRAARVSREAADAEKEKA